MVLTFQFNSRSHLPEAVLSDGELHVSASIHPLEFPISDDDVQRIDNALRFQIGQLRVKHATT